jgi:hypothetical protein
MKQGSAILLKEVLNTTLSGGDGNVTTGENSLLYDSSIDANRNLALYNGRNSLKEFGVIQLSPQEARVILNLRCDFMDLN